MEKMMRREGDNDGEAEEVEKMDKFYELIRRHSEVRDLHQRLKAAPHLNKVDEGEKVGDDDDDDKQRMVLRSSWMPSFKWEDFGGTVFHDQDHTNRERKVHVHDDDEEEDGVKQRCPQTGLDLNLAL